MEGLARPLRKHRHPSGWSVRALTNPADPSALIPRLLLSTWKHLSMSPQARKRLSPITQSEYHKGRTPANKGMHMAPEILTPREFWTFLESFGSSPTDIRNRAIVWMFYGPGVKIGELRQLELNHYDRESRQLTIPATRMHRKRTKPLDGQAIEFLDAWLGERKRLRISRIAPLFCNVHETPGRRLGGSQISEMMAIRARRLGLDKRVHSEGLRQTGRAHRAMATIEHELLGYLDEPTFRARYPRTYPSWKAAEDLFTVDPKQHSSNIGLHCVEAQQMFLTELCERHKIEPPLLTGTVSQLRSITAQVGPSSQGVRQFLQALIGYWGAVSDLAERQKHGAQKEGDDLGVEDARRLVFHLLIVMNEIDRSLPTV
jgi:hypothetical protein